jgi:hypothetical protein
LMRQYNLSMDKVFIEQSACITKDILTNRLRRHPIDWALNAIAEFCDCKVWFGKNQWQQISYHFFGLETDAEMAVYLFNIISNAMDNATDNLKNDVNYDMARSKKAYTVSFQKGMATRLSIRLRMMLDERRKAEQPIQAGLPATGTSLVLVKCDKVEREFKKKFPKMKKATAGKQNIVHDAFANGFIEGNKVNLNRPIEGRENLTIKG